MKSTGLIILWFIIIFLAALLLGKPPAEAAGCGGIGVGVVIGLGCLLLILAKVIKYRLQKRKMKGLLEK